MCRFLGQFLGPYCGPEFGPTFLFPFSILIKRCKHGPIFVSILWTQIRSAKLSRKHIKTESVVPIFGICSFTAARLSQPKLCQPTGGEQTFVNQFLVQKSGPAFWVSAHSIGTHVTSVARSQVRPNPLTTIAKIRVPSGPVQYIGSGGAEGDWVTLE